METQENLINEEGKPAYINQADVAKLMLLNGMCSYQTNDGYEFMLTIDDNKFMVRKV